MAISDLWTPYQFADVARSLAPPLEDGAEIERWRGPAETFCKELDTIVANELTTWQASYQEASKLRSDAADDGLKAAIEELRTSADTSAQNARDAAKRADDAAKEALELHAPARLNLAIAGSAPGSVVVRIDGEQVVAAANQRTFSVFRSAKARILFALNSRPRSREAI